MPKAKSDDKAVVESINIPGQTERLDRTKYMAVRDALLAVLPRDESGMTVPAAKTALPPHLPEGLLLPVSTVGWWLKAVQLDLEAKQVIKRAAKKPVHLYQPR